MRKRSAGFTLIEVLVTVVIIGILLRIAIPSYQESVKRSRRAEARTAMLGLAQTLERFFTNNNTYTGASLTSSTPIFPSNVPATGGTVNYTLTLDIGTDTFTGATAGSTYTITATRAGPQANDACGNFTLTASGVRGLTNNTKTVAECWN